MLILLAPEFIPIPTLSLLLASTLLFCSAPVLAQIGGGMGGMGGGGMGGMGGGVGGRHGEGGRGGGMNRANPPKPLERARYDKAVTAMFHEADVDHDGTVTIDEVRGIVEARRDGIIRARFASIDSDHNGTISQSEFFAWQRQMGSAASADDAGEHEGPVAEVIRPRLSNDPQGRIIAMLIAPLSATVVAEANRNYDAGVSLDELIAYEGKRFDAADTNHDGLLTFDEMRTMMPQRGRRREDGPPRCPPDEACPAPD